MITIVCSDRDGTVTEDEDYYLGSDNLWKRQVKFLDGVVEGIRLLNSRPDTKLFIVTNQSGVALAEPRFADLTEERMHEVNRYVLEQLKQRGAIIEGYFACPFVDNDYVAKATKKYRKVHPEYVRDGHPDLKPNIGMLEKCATQLGHKLTEVRLYVIGDRASDVQLGLNGGGTGILVTSFKTKQLGDEEKVRQMQSENPGRVSIAQNFLDAARYVVHAA